MRKTMWIPMSLAHGNLIAQAVDNVGRFSTKLGDFLSLDVAKTLKDYPPNSPSWRKPLGHSLAALHA